MVWMTTGVVQPPRTRQKLTWLVVSTYLKRFLSNWIISQNRSKSEKYLKPPPSNKCHLKRDHFKRKGLSSVGIFPKCNVHLENSHCQFNSHQLITLKNSNPVAPPPRKWLLFPGSCSLLSFNPLESCVFAQQVKLNNFLHVPGICSKNMLKQRPRMIVSYFLGDAFGGWWIVPLLGFCCLIPNSKGVLIGLFDKTLNEWDVLVSNEFLWDVISWNLLKYGTFWWDSLFKKLKHHPWSSQKLIDCPSSRAFPKKIYEIRIDHFPINNSNWKIRV